MARFEDPEEGNHGSHQPRGTLKGEPLRATFDMLFDANGLVDMLPAAFTTDSFRWTHVNSADLADTKNRVEHQLKGIGVPLPLTWNQEAILRDHVFIEDGGNFFHLVVYRLAGDIAIPRPETSTRAIHLLVHEWGILTWGDDADGPLATLHSKIQRYPRWITSRSALLFGILDGLFASWLPVIDRLDEAVVKLEQQALSSSRGGAPLQTRVTECKHQVAHLHRILISSRDMARNLSHRFPDEDVTYYFELYDQVSRLNETVEGLGTMLDTVLDLHLSTVSNRLNEVVKTLTLVTTMMLPASLVAAFYGMNFDHVPGIHWTYGFYMVLGFVALVSIGLLIWFKRRSWI